MFGREENRHLDTGGQHEIDIAPPIAVDAGLVGDEADPFAAQFGEIVGGENLQAGEFLGFWFYFAMHTRTDDGLVVAGQFHARSHNPERCGCNSRHAAAPRRGGMATVWMHSISQNDYIGAAERVNPYRSAGKSGVAIGTDRK